MPKWRFFIYLYILTVSTSKDINRPIRTHMHKADTEDAGIQNLFEKKTQHCIHPKHSEYVVMTEREGMKIVFISPIYRPT
jgi:hypothetical protein